MADLNELRSIENLRRAWWWVQSNPDASFKSYFRELYRNYAVAEDALLQNLSDRLRREIYQPESACKLFYPKASGIFRPYSLLTVEDQIVYQAAVNLIAERLFPRVNHRYFKQVFGHLYAGRTSVWFYRKWSDGYRAFNDAARQAFAAGFAASAISLFASPNRPVTRSPSLPPYSYDSCRYDDARFICTVASLKKHRVSCPACDQSK